MGVLKVVEKPLSWEETKTYREKIKHFGLIQFVKNYNRMKEKEDFAFKWGDEVEHYIINIDETNKTTSLCLKGDEVLNKLHALNSGLPEDQQIEWKPEYSDFMVEAWRPIQRFIGSTGSRRRQHADSNGSSVEGFGRARKDGDDGSLSPHRL